MTDKHGNTEQGQYVDREINHIYMTDKHGNTEQGQYVDREINHT